MREGGIEEGEKGREKGACMPCTIYDLGNM